MYRVVWSKPKSTIKQYTRWYGTREEAERMEENLFKDGMTIHRIEHQ